VVDKDLGLSGALSLHDELAEASRALKQAKQAGNKGAGVEYSRIFTILSLLGRDADAAQLLAAALQQDRTALTSDAALAGLTSAYLAGDLDTFIAAYEIAQPKLATEDLVRQAGLWDARDMLWQALWPTLGTLTRERAQLLSLNLRAQSLVRDAGEAFSAVSAAVNRDAARDVIARASRLAATEAERKQIEQIGK
jgi:hypothetical protein